MQKWQITKPYASPPVEPSFLYWLILWPVTPTGRVLNRFAADMDKIDLNLNTTISQASTTVFSVVGALIAIAAAVSYNSVNCCCTIFCFHISLSWPSIWFSSYLHETNPLLQMLDQRNVFRPFNSFNLRILHYSKMVSQNLHRITTRNQCCWFANLYWLLTGSLWNIIHPSLWRRRAILQSM